MNHQPQEKSLSLFSEHVAYIVTDLNGLISSIVNEEVESADFDNDLTHLFAKLEQVEEKVSELADLLFGTNSQKGGR